MIRACGMSAKSGDGLVLVAVDDSEVTVHDALHRTQRGAHRMPQTLHAEILKHRQKNRSE